MRAVLEAASNAEKEGDPAAFVTVVSTTGSTPQKAGAKMVVFGDGRLVGTIGGGCVEAEMIQRARLAIDLQEPQMASYDLTPDQALEDGLVCGGRMEVFIEPILSVPTLVLFGAGHVAEPLARLASAVGFRVEVADDRPKFANPTRFPDASKIVVEAPAEASSGLSLGRNAYVVVVTRGHKGDAAALEAVVGRGLRFVGLVGSKAKLVHVLAELEDRGVAPDALAEVRCPLGIEIGAETPEEIAVSILSEMVAVRRGVPPEDVRPMRAVLPGRMRVAR